MDEQEKWLKRANEWARKRFESGKGRGWDLKAFRAETGYDGPSLHNKAGAGKPPTLKIRNDAASPAKRISTITNQDTAYKQALEQYLPPDVIDDVLHASKDKHRKLGKQRTALNKEFGPRTFTIGHEVSVKQGGGDFGRNVRLETNASNAARKQHHDVPKEVRAALGIPSSGQEAAIMDISGDFDLPLTPKDRQLIKANPEMANDIIGNRLQSGPQSLQIRADKVTEPINKVLGRPTRKPALNGIPDDQIAAAQRLLNQRELTYQGALNAGRNDLLFREKVLNMLKNDYSVNPELVKDFDNMISQTRRARRDVVSEGSYLFEDDLLNSALGVKGEGNLAGNVNKTEGVERMASQPIKGTEAHHPASVSSTEGLVKNMDEFETRKLWRIAKENGYTVGSQREGFVPLSKPAHTTGGKNWGSDFAHVGADGKTPDPGRFKSNALPKGTTAEEAWPTVKKILDEQIQLNEKAYNHPTETLMRARVEDTLGPVEWRGPVTASRAKTNAASKATGVNATTISKALDNNPGLKQTGLVPNVDVMVKEGSRLPLGMSKLRIHPKALAIGGAIPGAVGAVFDSAALASAVTAPPTKSRRQQLVNALEGVSGATGLAALAPTPATVPLGAISMGTGLTSAAVSNKLDKKAVKAVLKIEQLKKKLDPLQPVKQAVWQQFGRLFGN